ncbi:MAG: 3-deoxy-8-phosphooctulonate synthase [Bilophila wadsworthia]
MMTSDELYGQLRKDHFIFAGPCALESFELALDTAHAVAEASKEAGLFAVFKSSWDKANRTSGKGFRGPGLVKGMEWLARIKEETGLPVVTDIHLPEQAGPVGEVADILQIPFFMPPDGPALGGGADGRVVRSKKGQLWLRGIWAPCAIKWPRLAMTASFDGTGSSFGYNNLVVDFRSIPIMRALDVPVIFDATHSVQLPGGQGSCSGGERHHVPTLARAAAGAGVDGIFMECHPDPDKALCDGPNSWPVAKLPALLKQLSAIWNIPYDL